MKKLAESEKEIKELQSEIESILGYKPIIDKYRHTILNGREVAEAILCEIKEYYEPNKKR